MPNRIYPIQKNGRFFNHNDEKRLNFLFPSLFMLAQSLKNRLSCDFDFAQLTAHTELVEVCSGSNNQSITWLGHATFLIKLGDINILTDPVFDDLTILYKRFLKPAIILENLPKIDFVLLSHNHRDHMEEKTLYTLKKNNPRLKFLVPMGDKQWFDKRGLKDSTEYMWWEQAKFSNIEFTFLPARHWSQRGLFDYNRSLWGSWMINFNGSQIYFAGDTAYSDHFKSIALEFGNIKAACMPIGPCEPRKWMEKSHMNSEQAAQAFLDLNGHNFIPMHWGTYYFGVDHVMLPIDRLKIWCESNRDLINGKAFHIVKCGQNLDLSQIFLDQI